MRRNLRVLDVPPMHRNKVLGGKRKDVKSVRDRFDPRIVNRYGVGSGLNEESAAAAGVEVQVCERQGAGIWKFLIAMIAPENDGICACLNGQAPEFDQGRINDREPVVESVIDVNIVELAHGRILQ